MCYRSLRDIIDRLLITVLFLIVASSWVAAQELSTLPYVPTPQVVVDEMLKIAKVSAGDYLVDLGSGDGRIVITAAKNFRTPGFGVDIEPKLVALANQQARAAGVADKVEFQQRDMFKTDIAKASVVALYVLPDFMHKLRSKVLNEVKPGTRIVAHDYDMGDWLPDDRQVLTVPEKIDANGTDKAYVYLWIVPSRVAGTWRIRTPVFGNNRIGTLTLRQKFQLLEASAQVNNAGVRVDPALLNGDEISFTIYSDGISHRFKGKVSGERIIGTVGLANGRTLPWTGTRITAHSYSAHD